MDLPTIWFIIVGYLFTGFFFLEGFDYGVGILSPFLSRKEDERRMMLSSIGGFWDGNEVWMITAGAVLFASFPNWYATLFGNLYLVFVVLLVALIARAVGIKFRNQRDDIKWRATWDWTIAAGSFLGAVLWGLLVGNLLTGIPLNDQMIMVGGIAALVNPFTLVTAAAVVLLFLLHGLLFLSIKASGDVLRKALAGLFPIYIPSLLMAAAFLIFGYFRVGLMRTTPEAVLAGAAVAALVFCGVFIFRKSHLGAFWASGAAIIFVTALVFTHMYPRVLISSLDEKWSLTIYNSCSSPYTLKVMSVVALFFIPTVLLYQGWTYWVLRKRIEKSDIG